LQPAEAVVFMAAVAMGAFMVVAMEAVSVVDTVERE
jgi:hypothetical protein